MSNVAANSTVSVKHPSRADFPESESSGAAAEAAPTDLANRLRQLCVAWSAQTGLDCRLLVRPEHTRFEAPVADVLYQAVRELLALMRRQAKTGFQVSSEVRDDGALALTVTSDGASLAASLDHDRVHLWGIDQRLREVGAYLEVIADPGRASVVLPGQLLLVR
jgi:signal transduction histidine kinase